MNWYRIKLAHGFPAGYWITQNGPIEVREYDGAGQHEEPVIDQIFANHGINKEQVGDLIEQHGQDWEQAILKVGLSQEEIDAIVDRQIAMKIGFVDFGWIRLFGDGIQTPSVSNEYMMRIKDALLQIGGVKPDDEYVIEHYPSGKSYRGVPFKMLEFIGSDKDLRQINELV